MAPRVIDPSAAGPSRGGGAPKRPAPDDEDAAPHTPRLARPRARAGHGKHLVANCPLCLGDYNLCCQGPAASAPVVAVFTATTRHTYLYCQSCLLKNMPHDATLPEENRSTIFAEHMFMPDYPYAIECSRLIGHVPQNRLPTRARTTLVLPRARECDCDRYDDDDAFEAVHIMGTDSMHGHRASNTFLAGFELIPRAHLPRRVPYHTVHTVNLE